MTRVILPVLLLGLLLSACTAGPNALTDTPDADGHVAGFW